MDPFPYTNKQKLWLKVPKVVLPVWIFRLLFHDGLLPLRHSHDLLVLLVLGPLLDGVLSVDFKFKAKKCRFVERKQTSFKLKLSIFHPLFKKGNPLKIKMMKLLNLYLLGLVSSLLGQHFSFPGWNFSSAGIDFGNLNKKFLSSFRNNFFQYFNYFVDKNILSQRGYIFEESSDKTSYYYYKSMQLKKKFFFYCYIRNVFVIFDLFQKVFHCELGQKSLVLFFFLLFQKLLLFLPKFGDAAEVVRQFQFGYQIVFGPAES
jgi:hypothetical protein